MALRHKPLTVKLAVTALAMFGFGLRWCHCTTCSVT